MKRILILILFPLCVIAKSSEWTIGPEGYYLRLKIKGVSPASTTPSGLWGAKTAYRYRPNNNAFLALDLGWAYGEVFSLGNPSRAIHDEKVYGRFGYTFVKSDRYHLWRLTPYAGFGCRYFIEYRRGTEAFAALKFHYVKYGVPIGLLVDYSTGLWSLGVLGEWIPDVDPMVLIPSAKGVRWNLAYENSYKAELIFSRRFKCAQFIELSLIPFFESLKLGKSKAKTSNGTALELAAQDVLIAGARLMLSFYW